MGIVLDPHHICSIAGFGSVNAFLLSSQCTQKTLASGAVHATNPKVSGFGSIRYRFRIGFFGMMVMMQYILFLYPTYIGMDSFVNLSGQEGLFAFANIWVFSTFVLGFTGAPMLRSAWISLRARQPNMDLLIMIAALSAYLYSFMAMVLGSLEVYFDVTVVIVLAVSIGQYYQQALKRKALSSLQDLRQERADSARLIKENGNTEILPLDIIPNQANIQVLQGERIPFDGQVIGGNALVDESLMTGESLPCDKQVGDRVLGGSILLDNQLTIQVDTDHPSTIDRLSELLWRVQSQRSGTQRLVDRLSAWFVPLVLVAAGFTLLLHLSWAEPFHNALLASLAVLIVSCPCALGLATPLALANGIRSAHDHGVIVQSTEMFERATYPQQIIFDKTGTLTTGKFKIKQKSFLVLDDRCSDIELLNYLAALEQHSTHPVGHSISEQLDNPAHEIFEVIEIETHARGIQARINGIDVKIGSLSWMRSQMLPDCVHEWLGDLLTKQENLASGMHVLGQVEDRGVVLFQLSDELRPNVAQVLKALHSADKQLIMLTGDTKQASKQWEDHPHVDRVFSEVRPESKAAIVDGLQQQGDAVMVGDGINDAGAMARASLGITFGSRSALARAAGDLIIPDDDITRLPYAINLASRVRNRMYQNLGWALLYNVIAIPLAALGWINPLFAALAMISSSFLIIVNSSRVIR